MIRVDKSSVMMQQMNTSTTIQRRNISFNSAINDFKSPTSSKDSYRFIAMSFLTTTMMIAEMGTAIITGSLTLLSDSLHMLSDLLALFIGFVAHRKGHSSTKNKDHFMVDVKYETVGALINGTVLLTSCFIMAIEAIQRIGFEHEAIENVNLVLIVGGMGFIINVIGLLIFGHHGHGHGHGHHHHEKNLNIHGVFLHILSDLFSSIAVISSALIIKYTSGWWDIYVDPGCTLIIVTLISRAAYPMMKQSITILLSKSPLHVDVLNQIEKQLKNINGILNVHELHCFEVKPGYYMATVHLIIDIEYELMEVKMSIVDQSKEILHRNGIHSSIVQSEFSKRGNKQWTQSINPCFDFVCNEHECIPKGIVLSNSLANLRKENENKTDTNIEPNQASHLLDVDLSLYNKI